MKHSRQHLVKPTFTASAADDAIRERQIYEKKYVY